MLLILDTNVLFVSSKSGRIIKLIDELHGKNVELIIPQFVFEELVSLKEKIMRYTGFNEAEFSRYLQDIMALVKVIPEDEYKSFMEEAKRISPDKKDVPLFALALKKECAIWSREPRLKRQKRIKVLDDKGVEILLRHL